VTREQKLWKLVSKYLLGAVDRVENVASPGFADVSGTYQGLGYWIELKAPKTKSYDLLELLEPSQRAWHVQRARAGAIIFVLVKNGADRLDLYRATYLPISSPTVCRYELIWQSIEGRPYQWDRFTKALEKEIR
jgi:hypothetical protein